MKERVQKFGRFLSGMVMPNIGAFIAWGLIAALFIPDGWLGKWGPAATINRSEERRVGKECLCVC